MSGLVRAPDRASATRATQRLLMKLYRESQDASIVIAGDSTSRLSGSWPGLFIADLALRWPAWTVEYAEWDNTNEEWPTTTVIQSGTGDRTLTLWNAAVGSQNITYHMARLRSAITDKRPDLVLISHGFNEPTGFTLTEQQRIDLARSRMLGLTESILELSPDSSICIIAQNPRTSSANDAQYQKDQQAAYAQVAALRGFGWIDVWRAFWATGDAANLTSDGVHPTSAGYRIYADTVLRAFPVTLPDEDELAMTGSTFLDGNGVNLLSNGTFDSFESPPTLPGWTASGATLSKDETNYEGRKGYSVRIQASGSGSTSITKEFAETLALGPLLAGQWVTLAARMWVAAATADLAAGQITLSAGPSEVSATTAGVGVYDQWQWVIASMYVPTGTTAFRVTIIADYSGNAGADISVDRVVLVRGLLPRDIAPANAVSSNEAGSFTPTVTFGTTGDFTCTYDVRLGRYSKVDNRVDWFITLECSDWSHSTASGGIYIGGLPYPAATATGAWQIGTALVGGYTFPSATALVSAIASGNSGVHILGAASGQATWNYLQATHLASGSDKTFYLAGSYATDS